jgi:hypothetical protein
MRIETLPGNNLQIQGTKRRVWLNQYAPQHLQHCNALILRALSLRDPATSQSTVVLGAGACTEVPLALLARSSEEVVLTDFDLASMQRGRAEIESPALQRRIRFVQCDLTGGVSTRLASLARRQDWQALAAQGGQTVIEAAASCLEKCQVPDPPEIHTLRQEDSGLVVSSLVLSQLFSYPLLDILDHIQQVASSMHGEQERNRYYQEAAQAFRVRVIDAHLHFMRHLLDLGGVAILLSDIRGFVYNVQGTDHDAQHRRYMPLVPRTFPALVQNAFTIVEEAQWDWITDLPEKERPGRGYEVVGYILKAR